MRYMNLRFGRTLVNYQAPEVGSRGFEPRQAPPNDVVSFYFRFDFHEERRAGSDRAPPASCVV
jgi:hypothetical protein